jgi:hypothetical protein
MKPTRRIFVWASLFLAVAISIGIFRSDIPSQVRRWSKSTSQFLPLGNDPRVLYEPGAETMANVIAQELPEAIRLVESKLHRPFATPPRIYVCASMASFDGYGGHGRSGFVFARRLFISPKPINTTSNRMPWLVAHELVHLHVQQRRNPFMGLFADPDPVWFTEGLAVYASNGGGGQPVTEQEAWHAIAEGRHFLNVEGYVLGQSILYRQCGLFIAYLAQLDAEKFEAFIFTAGDKRRVEIALAKTYGKNFDALWDLFVIKAAEQSR